jgi:hypothetical protein
MHEAERTLRKFPKAYQPGGVGHYRGLLGDMLGEDWGLAPATHRAEAFLRTIGKWEDPQ